MTITKIVVLAGLAVLFAVIMDQFVSFRVSAFLGLALFILLYATVDFNDLQR